jgi:hypothetical protein
LFDLSSSFRLAKLKGTPTDRPNGVAYTKPTPPPPPTTGKGGKAEKRRTSKAPTLTEEESQLGTTEIEKWIDYKGEKRKKNCSHSITKVKLSTMVGLTRAKPGNCTSLLYS